VREADLKEWREGGRERALEVLSRSRGLSPSARSDDIKSIAQANSHQKSLELS
jgi:hypothetical protein